MFGFRSHPAGAFKHPSNPSDTETVGRLRLTLLCGVFSAATAFSTPALAADPADTPAPPAAVALPVVATARPGANWAAPQIASVVVAGVMGPDVASFRPDDSLTRGELHAALVALGKTHAVPTDATRVVTMREFDAQLVAAAGLAEVALHRPRRLLARRAEHLALVVERELRAVAGVERALGARPRVLGVEREAVVVEDHRRGHAAAHDGGWRRRRSAALG